MKWCPGYASMVQQTQLAKCFIVNNVTTAIILCVLIKLNINWPSPNARALTQGIGACAHVSAVIYKGLVL